MISTSCVSLTDQQAEHIKNINSEKENILQKLNIAEQQCKDSEVSNLFKFVIIHAKIIHLYDNYIIVYNYIEDYLSLFVF